MSLKAFHVFFLVVSTVFSGGFGYYAIRQSMAGNNEFLLFGIVSTLLSAMLLGYSVWFLNKMKNVGYL